MRKGFPTEEVRNDDWYFQNEGALYHIIGTSSTIPNSATTIGATSGTTNIYVPPGRIMRLKGLSFSSDLPCTAAGFIVKGSWGSTGTGSTRLEIGFSSGGNGQTGYIDMNNILLFEDGLVSVTLAFNDPDKTKIAGAATYRSNFKLIPSAELLTFDRNWSADYTYLALGDSITEGHSMGSDAQGNHYLGWYNFTNVLRDTLINQGVDIRVNNAGWGGAKAFNLYKAIKSGYFQTSNPDLITIGFGMNDCVNSNAGDLTNYISYINFAISYFYQKNPNVSIVLIGPNATNDATRTPTIGNFRAALASIAAAPPVAVDIKYYDSSTAFFVGENDALYFRDTEVGTSAMIHPSGVGSTLIGNGLYTIAQTTKFYKNAIA
jgi:lysophospholipase L1-like esterase